VVKHQPTIDLFRSFNLLRENVPEILMNVDFEVMEVKAQVSTLKSSPDLIFQEQETIELSYSFTLGLVYISSRLLEQSLKRNYVLELDWPYGGKEVSVSGSWDNWFKLLRDDLFLFYLKESIYSTI
jgi:hypothetical protein